MTYDPQIPLVTESPLTSASPIQVNFDQFAKIFSNLSGMVNYNHMPFNNPHQGKHGAMVFQNQTVDPEVTGDWASLYPKNVTSAAGTEPQLFARIPKFLPTEIDTTDATNSPMQLTYNSVNTSGPMYYSFLPGGYIWYFGRVILTAANPHTITLSPIHGEIMACFAFPETIGSGSSAGRPLKISVFNKQPNPQSFKVYVTLAGSTLYSFSWMAIAKQ